MALWLKREEVAPLIDLPRAIDVIEAACAEQGRGLAVSHAPYPISMETQNPGETAGPLMQRRLRVVSGGLLGSERVGLRMGPRDGGALSVLFDCSGELLAVMASPFDVMRTAATVAVAVKHLARQDAHRVGLIGTGRSAVTFLEALRYVRPIDSVAVYSRDEGHRLEFADRASKDSGLNVLPVDRPDAALGEKDIVIVSTSSRQPVFDFGWLDPGSLLCSAGPLAEVDPTALERADLLVVGSKGQERHFHFYDPRGPFRLEDLVDQGKLTWDQVAELGEIVIGTKPGRVNNDQIAVFHESQGGVGDVALASAAYAEAVQRGLGLELQL